MTLDDDQRCEKVQLSNDEYYGVAADLFCPYHTTGNGLEGLLECIFSAPKLYRHYIVFSQSSGYGKTRLLMHLLLHTYAGVMLLCGDIYGGFRMSAEIEKLVSNFNEQTEDWEKTVIVAKFLKRMCLYIECYQANKERLFYNQFDREAGKYRVSFADPLDAFQKPSPERRASTDVAREAHNDSGRHTVSFDSTTMVTPEDMEMKKWIIVFDEAQCLGEELLARLKVVLDQFGVVGVFLSTCGHIAKLLPKTVSARSTKREVVAPVHVLRTFDLYSSDCHRLHLGRPLWKLLYETRFKRDFKLLLRYAVSRLCGVTSTNATENFAPHEQSTLLSLFMVRFGGISPIDSIAGSAFVTHHMATYTKLGVAVENQARSIVTEVTYPSEPILAEASAFCTSAMADQLNETPRLTKTDVIRAVATCVRSATLVQLDKGNIGEMMACALVGYQLDLIREKAFATAESYNPVKIEQSMASPVAVADFLVALYSGAQDCVSDLPELMKYSLNVNHFVRLQYPSKYSTCAEMITRGAAVITYECSPGLDFFMEATRNAAVVDVTEDSDTLALDDSTPPESGLTRLNSTFCGVPLYRTINNAVVYYQSGKKIYLGGRPFDKTDMGKKPPPAAPRSPPGTPTHQNIHVRVSVKNYASDISSAAAETMLDSLNTACEPVAAVAGGGKETILVNILINMGPGLLVPSISVATPRSTRSGDASYSKAVRLAVGLNHGDDLGRHSCFAHFPPELLRAFRDVTSDRRGKGDQEEDYWAMRYGGDFFNDMNKCTGVEK